MNKSEVSDIKNYIFDGRNLNISLYVVLNKRTVRNPFDVYKFSIKENIVELIKEFLGDTLTKIEGTLENQQIIDIPLYDFNLLKQSISIIKSTELNNFDDLKQKLIGDNPVPYVKEQVKNDKIKAWVMRIEYEKDGNTKQIFLFQKFSVSKMMQKNRVGIFSNANGYEIFDKDIFYIERNIDIIMINDSFIIFDRKKFDDIFDFHEVYIKEATAFFEKMLVNQEIDEFKIKDFEKIKDKIINSRLYTNKLYKVSKNGYYKKIKLDKLKDLNNNYNLGLRIENNEWVIEENIKLKDLLDILNDDYQKSKLTDNDYKADSKEKI